MIGPGRGVERVTSARKSRFRKIAAKGDEKALFPEAGKWLETGWKPACQIKLSGGLAPWAGAWGAVAALWVLLLAAGPAAGQVTCRTDGLGATVCIGTPAPRLGPRPAFPDPPPGLGRVQRPAGVSGGPAIVPEGRGDALGNVVIAPGDLPPPRAPRGLEREVRGETDALGNRICR